MNDLDAGQEARRREGKHHHYRCAGKASDIKGRVEFIREQAEEATSDYYKGKLQERVAELSAGAAVINVGTATEVDTKEREVRVAQKSTFIQSPPTTMPERDLITMRHLPTLRT